MAAESEHAERLIEEGRDDFFCALVSDALDSLGCEKQAMPSRIRPIDEALIMVGRARTMLYADVYARPKPSDNPYELEKELVNNLRQGDVAVCACGGIGRIVPWGGLLSTAGKLRGATGASMDGMVREIKDMREMQFPVLHAGIGPLDSKGRGQAVAIDVPVECGGVLITP